VRISQLEGVKRFRLAYKEKLQRLEKDAEAVIKGLAEEEPKFECESECEVEAKLMKS
jgi:hypothetical protein